MFYFDDDVQSQYQSTKGSTLICTGRPYSTTRNSSDCCLVYSARGFFNVSGCVLGKVRFLTFIQLLDNCNKVGIQLPHDAHISTASCLNNTGERNDVLVVSVRVQNV